MSRKFNALLGLGALAFASSAFAQCPSSPVPPWSSQSTLGGAVDLKIPPDSDTGRKLRLRGRGLPGTPPGDQIVELEVTAPRADTDEQRKAYAALGKAFGNA